MGEPTLVMHSFSCTYKENENPMYALGDSVSFGRYMTEELSWERWSVFSDSNNRKRYVEEAEKYSRPGSVAQKKAYFEAHFKRVALKESVEFEVKVDNCKTDHENGAYGQNEVNECDKGRVESEMDEKDEVIVVEKCESESSSVDVEKEEVDVKDVKEEEKEDPAKENASLDQVEMDLISVNDENCYDIKEESSRISEMVVLSPLQEVNIKQQPSKLIAKTNPPLSSNLPLVDGIFGAHVFTPSPLKSTTSVYAGKENYPTPVKQKSFTEDPNKKGTPLHPSINRDYNKISSPVINKIGSSSQSSEIVSLAKVSINGIVESSPLNSNSSKRGDISRLDSVEPRPNHLSSEFKHASIGRNKARSPIIPSCFCWSRRDGTARRKLEKAVTRFNKFSLSFCFKAMPSSRRI